MILKRAVADTISGHGKARIVAFIGFLFALWLHAYLAGWEAAMDEAWLWLLYSLAGGSAGLLALFLWNLASSPYSIEKERREKLEGEILTLENTLIQNQEEILNLKKSAPNLILGFEGIGLSAEAGPDVGAVIFYLSIRNIGGKPSAALNWAASIKFGAEEHPLAPTYAHKITASSMGGGSMTYDQRDCIIEKASDPIPAYGVCYGYYLAIISEEFARRILVSQNCTVKISCMQVDGRMATVEAVIDERKVPGTMSLPGFTIT